MIVPIAGRLIAASLGACAVVAGLFAALLLGLHGRALTEDSRTTLESLPYMGAALAFTFILFAANAARARQRLVAVAVLVGVAVSVGAGMHACATARSDVAAVDKDRPE